MAELEIRRLYTVSDESLREGDRAVGRPVKRVGVAAVIANPLAGQYGADLDDLIAFGEELGGLLTQRAVEAGELTSLQARKPARRLGDATDSDPDLLDQLPASALQLVQASSELYARVRRLDEGTAAITPQPSPARTLLSRLERSL